MQTGKLHTVVTVVVIFVGFVIVGLWLLVPFSFSVRRQAPISSHEVFLLKTETELDKMRMLLALRTSMGFIEAQDPAERIRDLCFHHDRKAWKRWSRIVDDMNDWHTRFAIRGTASLGEVLGELYAKYPFLKLAGVKSPKMVGDMIVKTPAAGEDWHTTQTEWQPVPGLLIRQRFDKCRIVVGFESDMILTAAADGHHGGFIRLVINGEKLMMEKIEETISSGGMSNPESVLLLWRGELDAGEHVIGIEARVAGENTVLRVAEGDKPKLLILR